MPRLNIAKLKIRDRPTAEKLFQVLQSTPPKDPQTAKNWFKFLAEKGGKQFHSPGVSCVY
jgi:Protein of unknown function (DUF3684)